MAELYSFRCATCTRAKADSGSVFTVVCSGEIEDGQCFAASKIGWVLQVLSPGVGAAAMERLTFTAPVSDPNRDITLTCLSNGRLINALSMVSWRLGSMATSLGLQIFK